MQFSELFIYLSNNTLSRAELSNSGEIRNIHYGDVLIKYGEVVDIDQTDIPYVADVSNLKKPDYLFTGDVIIADTAEDETVGKAVEIINNSSVAVVSGLHTIPCRPNSRFIPSYLGYYVNSAPFHTQLFPYMQGIKVSSISKGNIGKTYISFPALDEQSKITNMLNLLSSRIAKQRQLVEALKSYKRGAMQRIFHQSPSTIRTPDWTIVCLGDIFKKVFRRNTNGEVKNVITNSAEYGLIPQREFFDKDIAVDGNTSNYYVIEQGDFVYNPRKSTTAPFGPFNRYELDDKGIISPLYTCLVLQAEINPIYLAWYFKSDAWHRYIYDNGSQGVRHDRVSMTDDLLIGIPVMIPDTPKQKLYADVLDKLENRVHAAQTEYELLCKMKNGYLQQLFI